MTAQARLTSRHQRATRRIRSVRDDLDFPLLLVAFALLGIGLVLVSSASLPVADRDHGQPLYYFGRQLVFAIAGISIGAALWRVPLAVWERAGGFLIMIGALLLVLVLVPGVGREVNGSMRWLPLGPVNLQVSELMKLFMVIYVAGYLVRRGDEVASTTWGFIKPLLLLAITAVLLLVQPDFGATAVLLVTAAGMLFMGGARLWQFTGLLVSTGVLFAALVAAAPYRMQRVTAFLDPWGDPYDTGFQLTQALIAFGRGEWSGVGLGASVQKLFYLPEAHTDFLFAVLAEESGLLGTVVVIALFSFMVWRAFSIAALAEAAGKSFGACLACGLGLLFGLQAFVNIGVNMGLLPTKGLTLPLMSYGGSSLVVSCVVVSLLLRVAYEARLAMPSETLEQVRWSHA